MCSGHWSQCWHIFSWITLDWGSHLIKNRLAWTKAGSASRLLHPGWRHLPVFWWVTALPASCSTSFQYATQQPKPHLIAGLLPWSWPQKLLSRKVYAGWQCPVQRHGWECSARFLFLTAIISADVMEIPSEPNWVVKMGWGGESANLPHRTEECRLKKTRYYYKLYIGRFCLLDTRSHWYSGNFSLTGVTGATKKAILHAIKWAIVINVTFLSFLEGGSEMALAAETWGVVTFAVTHTHAVSSGGLIQ